MASLNLSINGPSIKSSYQGVINGPPPSSNSPTYAQWALFSVQAPLLNAFQDSGAKESVLKVEGTGDGELEELIEDFNEGRIQFAFVKVKDPNTALPKNVLIAWCGGGVPERTKGYFTSHLAAVSKVLHGYHVQITARSDADLSPESIVRKVADASGAKYTAGGSAPSPAAAAPPVAKKPVFTPKSSSGAGAFNPLVAARQRKDENVDEDGWGADAPPVSRSELQKVESAYKPTKVNMAELVKQKQEPSKFNGGGAAQDDRPDVVKGAYQPVGKVDIAAIRAAAKEKPDDRPTIVKGAYEPVGKVDIAAIRARAQKPASEESEERPKTLAERSSAFSSAPQAERLVSLPKPKVASKFAGASSFTGTKAPLPGALGLASPSVSVPAPPPVGAASRTFADQGGKTPAQLWAEKKGKQGAPVASVAAPAVTSPVAAQKSGGGSGWQSGYSGKSWGTVQTTNFGRGGGAVVENRTGGDDQDQPEREQPQPPSPAGGVSSIRDRFKEAPPMGAAAPSAPKVPSGGDRSLDEPSPPPPNMSNRPGGPAGGFALPGLPTRPPEPQEDEEEEERARSPSPPRVAIPVPRGPDPQIERPAPEPTIPAREIERALPKEDELEDEHDTQARAAATAVAEDRFGHSQVAAGQASMGGGKRALIQYDYEKAEDNELELVEGEYVTNIEMVDEDWWMGTNSRGESGLFPSNYVELVEDEDDGAGAATSAQPPPAPAQAQASAPASAAAPAAAQNGPTATALYDYEAAEDNELSFPEGAKVTDLEFPDDDWWFGHFQGKSGLFPANYVELDQ